MRGQWIGGELRKLREAAGLTLAEVADYLSVKHQTTISRYETGVLPMPWPEVDVLLTLYGLSDQERRDELIAMAKEAWRKGWYEEYRDVVGGKRFLDAVWLESRARQIRAFSLGFLPGAWQTADYMAALFRDDPHMDEGKVARAIELRRARQQVLKQARNITFSLLMSEAVLHQRVGGSTVMAGQLNHLLAAAAEGRLSLKVLPFAAPVYRGLAGDFTLFDLSEPFTEVAYVENFAGTSYVESPLVDRFVRAYDDMDGAALSAAASVRAVEEAIKGMT